MRIFGLLSAIFGSLLFSSALAQETTMNEENLIKMYRTYNQAMVQADVETLDKLLSDDFSLTHITGYVQPKAEWLADVQSGRMSYSKTEEHSVTANLQGSKAKIIGQAYTTANIWGAKGTWALQLDFDLAEQQGQWKMTKAVATLFK